MKSNMELMLQAVGGLAENLPQQAQHEEPELKHLTLEGVQLTLKDVNLNMPESKSDNEQARKLGNTVGSMEQRLLDLQLDIQNMQEMAACLTSPLDATILRQTLANVGSDIDQIAGSILKTAPK